MSNTLFRQILIPALLIAFTDVTLQLDNAIAISTVASEVPVRYRVYVLGGGVLVAAACLLGFTLIGSTLIHRLTWLKPVAGLVLILIGAKLAFDYFAAR
jgi:predicted tellurium resistance membrane protein TerC